jgi:heme exporter protein D
LRILWRILGGFSFLAVMMFGMAVVPLVLIIALDGVVAVMILDTLWQHRSRENRSVRLAEPARWA